MRGRMNLCAWLVALVIAMAVLYAQPPETLTEIDKLRIENTNLFDLLKATLEEADTCRGQLARPRAQANEQQAQERRTKLKADIEAAHPGFDWIAETGQLVPAKNPGR